MGVLTQFVKAAHLLARSLRVDDARSTGATIQFVGDYREWAHARRASMGYDSDAVLDRAFHAAMKVKNGEVAYERDSVVFAKIEYSFPLLAALLLAVVTKKRLSVLDFGGAFGSSYFQNRGLLRDITELKWGIVEQEKLVARGNRYIADDVLSFYHSVDECVREIRPNFVLMSGVLNYVQDPPTTLRQLITQDVPFFCFDRTLVAVEGETRLTVQVVPAEIYEASYPCWIMSEEELLAPLEQRYRRVFDFSALGGELRLDNLEAAFKGYLYVRADAGVPTGKIL